jgi:hypothetical protein
MNNNSYGKEYDFDLIINELDEGLDCVSENNWDEIPGDSFPLNLEKYQGFSFDIRTKEQNHHVAHFHVKKAEFEGSFSIKPIKLLSGNFPNKNIEYILEWAEKHQEDLIELWNRVHPHKKIQKVGEPRHE